MAGGEREGREGEREKEIGRVCTTKPDWDVDLLIVIMKIPKQAIKGINETKRNVMEWMNEWMNGLMEERMDERMARRMWQSNRFSPHCKWETDRQRDRDKKTNRQTERQTGRQTGRQSARQTDGKAEPSDWVNDMCDLCRFFSPLLRWLLLANVLFVLQLNLCTNRLNSSAHKCEFELPAKWICHVNPP